MRSPTDADADSRAPVDLVVVALLAVAVAALTVADAPWRGPVRAALAVVGFFLPGYALVAALFPRGPVGDREASPVDIERVHYLDGFTRAVLAGALALVVSPLLGIAADLAGGSITTGPVIGVLVGFTLVACAVAAVRRRRLPPADRYRPGARWAATLRRLVRNPDRETVAGVVVALAVVIAAGGVVSAAVSQPSGEQFSELSIVTASESGQLTAANYPENLTLGEPATVRLGVENHEGQTVEYTVVVVLQRLDGPPRDATVTETATLDRFALTVADGATDRRDVTVQPTMTGKNLRLAYLLYVDAPPDQPTPENADREAHVWVTVEDDTGDATA
ncbi:DUF1616 domain-containing protein [Halocalculus aciditolerans]|uniref:DUF1616 domain-containing protein n=1 Tax=Halocalculus aciditolerans TaxID=1383812 RepID=A0A830F2F2_9EURY|nr:DUF1616 domain-containing protein [Halocalculus aciditolerans]GGL55897.1 hypothetical protein GCM10009039_12590 [Halocalculus aciditolerans]